MQFPEKYKDLLSDNTHAFAFLATIMADGSPQVTPVWFDSDGTHILINTAEGRVKDRNMQTHQSVALVIMDPTDPYRYLQIRGDITERTHAGADEHINRLSLKYHRKAWKPVPGQTRVTYKIRPRHFDQH